MKIYVEGPSARREVLDALCRLPEPVRRYALEHVTIAGVGDAGCDQSIVGLAIGPKSLQGSEWVVPLIQRDGIGATLAHELAHVMAGDDFASGEAEGRATAQANEWGFADGDPAGAEARFQRRQRAVSTRARADGDRLSLSCLCGMPCRVLAPTVAGLSAEVGLECRRCGWVVLRSLADLIPCLGCNHPATVTWSERATPGEPRATWVCECGRTTTLALTPEPDPAEVSPDLQSVRWVASLLMGAEETLRQVGGSDADEQAAARESCRVNLVLAGQRLRRTAAAIGVGRRADTLLSMADELGIAVADFHRDEAQVAADRAAAVAHALNDMSWGSELRIGTDS